MNGVDLRQRMPAFGTRVSVVAAAAILTWLMAAWSSPTAVSGVEQPDTPDAPIVETTPNDFKLPGTLPNGLNDSLVGAEYCTSCHVAEITDNYFGSMMGNSGRNPLFRAALAVANKDAAGGGELCIRCHAPSAWLNGRSTPTDGSAINAADLQGVACSVCHRLVSPRAIAGEPADDAVERQHIKDTQQNTSLVIGSAAFIVDREDVRRGPFAITVFDHETAQSSLQRNALICSYCHEIDNPLLSWDETVQDFLLNDLDQPVSLADKMFPVERTFSEWQFSAFNPDSDGDGLPDGAGGVQALSTLYPGIKRKTETENGPITVCQDCHMPLANGALTFGGPTRTVGKHQWAGGSAVWQRAIAEFWGPVSSDFLFTDMVEQLTVESTALGNQMLSKAAELELAQNGGVLTVKITNRTGHKLPTGYAEGRRMWLHVRALGASNQVLAEWGAPNEDGSINNPERVYEIKQGISDGHALEMGRPDLAGEGFHFILNNKVFKDNRIPPRGWEQAGYAAKSMLPVGHDYAEGQFWDISAFALPVGTTRVEARLLYQTTSDEYLDFLESEGSVAVPDAVVGEPVNWGQVVGDLRDQLDLDDPVLMTSATLNIPGGVKLYLPTVMRD
jgi:hypothetical protein